MRVDASSSYRDTYRVKTDLSRIAGRPCLSKITIDIQTRASHPIQRVHGLETLFLLINGFCRVSHFFTLKEKIGKVSKPDLDFKTTTTFSVS
jgi:hypothetical protein